MIYLRCLLSSKQSYNMVQELEVDIRKIQMSKRTKVVELEWGLLTIGMHYQEK